MPSKDFTLDDNLVVSVHKRRGNRNLRLTVSPEGRVRVSIPVWAPYKTGVDFALLRRDWILSQQKAPHILQAGESVGKAHRLEFRQSTGNKVTSRVQGTVVRVIYPRDLLPKSPEVQRKARAAAVRALRIQAERLLPGRVAELAAKHGFKYRSVRIKHLKSRWGSCDQHSNITLNLFLLQLPWDLIDYVIMHELVHTEVLRHGPDFWTRMATVTAEPKVLRKRLHDYQAVLGS